MSRADTVFLLHFADVCIDMYVEEEWPVVSNTFNKVLLQATFSAPCQMLFNR